MKRPRRAVVRVICLRSATLFLQSIHLLVALLLAVAAILGFAAAPSMFDLLSSYSHREVQAINGGHGLFQVFNNVIIYFLTLTLPLDVAMRSSVAPYIDLRSSLTTIQVETVFDCDQWGYYTHIL